MKTLKLNALMLIALFLFTANSSIAKEEYKKNYQKQFEVSENTTFFLVNKYGDVSIKNWEKDIISIDVTVTVEARNEGHAEDLFEKIQINFSSAEDLVKAETEITESMNNTDFSIDYDINVPKYIKLNASNKYGSMFINEISGYTILNVKYGKLKINKLSSGNAKPRSELNIGYSSASIEQCDWLKINIKYSKLDIDESKALIILSKSSKLYFNKSNSIVAESKYDDPFNIGAVKNFVCTGKYSKYEIEELSKKLDVDVKYSDIQVEKVSADFESINVIMKYGNADISISPEASYFLEAESSYGDIDCPSGKRISKVRDNTDLQLKGIVGNGENPKAKVTLSSQYGDIDLD